MKPEFQPIRVSIVDILGAFLPGLIWLVLIVTFAKIITHDNQDHYITPLHVCLSIMEVSFDATEKVERGIPFYIGLIFAGLLLGYLIRPLATRVTEMISSLDAFWKNKQLQIEDKNYTFTRKDFRFPYNAYHSTKPYFEQIILSIEMSLGTAYRFLPGSQPFSTCKRILKVLNFSLWEDSEYAEAEIRMIGSLFLASIFSLILSIISITIEQVSLIWIVSSLLLIFMLALGFRVRRRREVGYVYLHYLIASKFPIDKLPVTDKRNSD
jgi:hypothetical protein